MAEPHRDVAIVCLPPETAVESDLEDINEDDLLPVDPTDITGQLEVQCESDPDVEDAPKRRKTGENCCTMILIKFQQICFIYILYIFFVFILYF